MVRFAHRGSADGCATGAWRVGEQSGRRMCPQVAYFLSGVLAYFPTGPRKCQAATAKQTQMIMRIMPSMACQKGPSRRGDEGSRARNENPANEDARLPFSACLGNLLGTLIKAVGDV